MQKLTIRITGSVVSLYNENRKIKLLFRRRIVEPEWLSLWYKVVEGEFDEGLWLRLNDVDREFMVLCVNRSEVENPKFNIAVSKDNKKELDQMRIIEGELLAGNISSELVEKYNGILDKLSRSGQMPKIHATQLKKRMQRTFKSLKG